MLTRTLLLTLQELKVLRLTGRALNFHVSKQLKFVITSLSKEICKHKISFVPDHFSTYFARGKIHQCMCQNRKISYHATIN